MEGKECRSAHLRAHVLFSFNLREQPRNVFFGQIRAHASAVGADEPRQGEVNEAYFDSCAANVPVVAPQAIHLAGAFRNGLNQKVSPVEIPVLELQATFGNSQRQGYLQYLQT